MLMLFIQLLIAHVIGDFVLQPDKWVADKRIKKYKSKYLYFHGLVHLVALLVVLQFKWSYLGYIMAIVCSHLIIDSLKLHLENDKNTRLLFLIDQVVHLAIIGVVVYLIHPYSVNFSYFYSVQVLLFVLSLLLVTYVSSVIIKMIMSKWDFCENNAEDSLQNAGKYIGIIERLFVFGFILMNQWSVIGLLLGAKSVFRFGDLSRAKDRKLTEYVLIGTLLSFGLAIIISMCYLYLLKSSFLTDNDEFIRSFISEK